MNFQLVKLQRCIEIVFNSLWRLSQAHFMPSIRAKAIDVTLYSESKCVSITTAHLDDLIEYLLDSRRLVNYDLTSEHSIAQAQLSLTIISKGVQLTSFRHDGRV